MTSTRLNTRQRAQVIVIFPIAILMLLGMAAMAIDGGRLFLGRQELQKAAEAAALDGAIAAALVDAQNPDPASNSGTVEQAVTNSLRRNLGVANTICRSVSVDHPIKYPPETLDGKNVNGVYVRIWCTPQLTAAAMLPGVAGMTLGADAEAVLGSKDAAGKFQPYELDPTSPFPRVLPPPQA
jgi:putative Flp pilus-assembly TadE/G-like protein